MFIRLLFHTYLIFVEIGEDGEERRGWSTDSIPDASRQTKTSVDLRRAPTVIHTSSHRCFWDEGRWGWRWEDNGRAGGKKLIYSCYSYHYVVCVSIYRMTLRYISSFLIGLLFSKWTRKHFFALSILIPQIWKLCVVHFPPNPNMSMLIHTHQHDRHFREPQWDWGSLLRAKALLRSLLTVLTGQASGSATLCGER